MIPINENEEKIKLSLTSFLFFAIIVVLSVKHYPNDDFLSIFLNFLVVLLFVNRFIAMLTRINQTNYIKQVTELKTISRAELKQKVEPIRTAKLKSAKKIYLFSFLVFLPVFFGLEWAYNADAIFFKSFAFTNLIIIFYAIDRKVQLEQGLHKILIKEVN